MMPEPLTLVCPSAGPRLRDVIETALCDLPVRNAQGDLRGARILFALDAGSAGMDEPTLRLLRRLRSEPGCLEGSVCGFVVDGETELYTKALAQDLALAANLAGAALPGKPLVEGTGSLYNQHILAARRGMSWEETYRARTRELGERLLAFSPKRVGRPKLLVLHASESGRSSTLWIGRELSRRLSGCCIRRDAVTSLQAPSSSVIAGREAPSALPLGELSPKVTERALQALPIRSGHR